MKALFPGRGLFTACLALVLSITAAPLAAQILYGSIVGVVKDTQGAVMPGATITIVNRDTNLTRETTTDAQGNYSIVNVLPGSYNVRVSLQGFRENVRSGVPVIIGEISRVEVTLELGALTETITVASSTNLLQTDLADVHTELRSAEIQVLPLNRFRNYQALMNLVPGTTPMAFGNAETDTPARSLATNVNGQANTNNSTRTDGATNMNIWLPNHNMYISPAETVEAVNIATSSFDAEQGMAGGAAVTVITKSGTNQFKGSAFEFYNGEKLNSKPAFFGVGPAPPKLPLKANTFGGTIGGPVARDRVFFFGSYEGYKREHSLFTFFSVPDERLRRGDFSQALNANGTLQQIYNPFTAVDGTNRQQFPNNQIPANLIDPIALKVLQLYPLPNVPGIGAGGLTNNYRRQETRTVDRKNVDVKVNFNRNTDHQIWTKFSMMDAVVDDLTNYLGPDPNAEGDGGFTRVYQATAGQTWTLSSTMLMDMTFGFGRQDQEVLGPDFQAGNYGLDVLGIPGTNDQGIGDQRYAGYPRFQMSPAGSGFNDVGNRDGWNPIYRDERTYSLTANLTKIKGSHDFRTGYTLNFLYLDHWQPETGNPRGYFQFLGNTTALRGGQTANFYNQYASFMLGLIGTANKSLQNELMTGREWQHALYFRDRWSPSDKLTLDLGLRWEFYPIMTRAEGRGIDRVDPANLNVIVAGVAGNDQRNGMKASLDNFAPRLGGIYRLNDKTVLRSGYGITYNAQPWARALRGDNDYPVTVASTYQNAEQFAWYGPLAQGIPRLVGPNTSSGQVRLDNAAIVYTPEVGNVDRGMVQTWNAAVERRLPYDLSVDVAYVGAKGSGGWAGIDINAPQTLGVGDAGRPYASMGRIQPLWSWGQRLRTRYNSMQVAVNKPFTRGLMVKGAYTLAKAMNDHDQDGRATLLFNTPSEVWRNWGPAGFDRRHNLQVAFAYQLPGQSTGSYDNILKAIVQDWQINGMFAAFSGVPFHVIAAGTSLNTPQNQQMANFNGTFNVLGNVAPNGTWFDTSAFSQPTNVGFGNVTRNQFYGPGGKNFDFSLFRSFPLGGSRRIEARIQANNLFNWVVLANPQNNITSGTFGQITGIAGDAALTNASYRERQIALGLRFSF